VNHCAIRGHKREALRFHVLVISTNDTLPNDVETRKRLVPACDAKLVQARAEVASARAEASSAEALVVHLRLTIEKLKRHLFGARNERKAGLIDQMELQLEERGSRSDRG
jgi:hypothetical protein